LDDDGDDDDDDDDVSDDDDADISTSIYPAMGRNFRLTSYQHRTTPNSEIRTGL